MPKGEDVERMWKKGAETGRGQKGASLQTPTRRTSAVFPVRQYRRHTGCDVTPPCGCLSGRGDETPT